MTFKQNMIRYVIAILVMIASVILSDPLTETKRRVLEENLAKSNSGSIHAHNLSEMQAKYRLDNVFFSNPGAYYRLILKYHATRESSVVILASGLTGVEQEIGRAEFQETKQSLYHEVIFKAEGNYTDIIINKVEKEDGANIDVERIQITPLNVTSDNDINNLRPTIIGSPDILASQQKQIKDASIKFEQLKKENILLGQFFTASDDYLAGVGLNIKKEGNGGIGKYILEIRESRPDKKNGLIYSRVMAKFEFDADNMESYKEEDDKYLFPLEDIFFRYIMG